LTHALFVGLCTLDVIQLVDHVPASNEKLRALDQLVAAGGPATNAAVTHAHLGGSATLLTALGRHPLTAGIRADLAESAVRVVDLTPDATTPPPVSTVLVTAATGDRAVASTNATGRSVPVPAPPDLDALVRAAHAVELDGHHMPLALATARAARAAGRLTVLDAGSWKDGTADLLPYIDVAVCSADFHPPGTSTPREVLAHLRAQGVRWPAMSRGPSPILLPDGEVPVPPTPVADTLGAGDILHGALTYHLTAGTPFPQALREAAATAARACASFGTRAWMR
jgi:sugar/nucleoside kinase (ribokinase family)